MTKKTYALCKRIQELTTTNIQQGIELLAVKEKLKEVQDRALEYCAQRDKNLAQIEHIQGELATVYARNKNLKQAVGQLAEIIQHMV